jgi:hypothetical protein
MKIRNTNRDTVLVSNVGICAKALRCWKEFCITHSCTVAIHFAGTKEHTKSKASVVARTSTTTAGILKDCYRFTMEYSHNAEFYCKTLDDDDTQRRLRFNDPTLTGVRLPRDSLERVPALCRSTRIECLIIELEVFLPTYQRFVNGEIDDFSRTSLDLLLEWLGRISALQLCRLNGSLSVVQQNESRMLPLFLQALIGHDEGQRTLQKIILSDLDVRAEDLVSLLQGPSLQCLQI